MISKQENSKPDFIYCTECGEALDNFCFDNESNNKQIINEQFHKCKKSKKFNGDVCSKLFISNNNLDEPIE
jgi:hypothetical protein